jgi:hypothetical protein
MTKLLLTATILQQARGCREFGRDRATDGAGIAQQSQPVLNRWISVVSETTRIG